VSSGRLMAGVAARHELAWRRGSARRGEVGGGGGVPKPMPFFSLEVKFPLCSCAHPEVKFRPTLECDARPGLTRTNARGF